MPEKDPTDPGEFSSHQCPVCGAKSLQLMEAERDIPYFGKVFLFSMTCSSCKYHKSDVECDSKKDPSRYTLEIGSEADLKVRVVKSAEATVKIPYITTITPGPASQGYVTNVEGILQRVKNEIEAVRDTTDDDGERQEAKNLIKKLINIMWGKQKQKVIIEDPSGNSAIISDRAIVEKMKASK
ncbi:ZPR1 zinc finger domain-containing protein [Candidatus Woesearchaeota archaeon]|nr:ZPR1 zinc finger domain-containing protein [Candidatus Woesearchaeota archaeon]